MAFNQQDVKAGLERKEQKTPQGQPVNPSIPAQPAPAAIIPQLQLQLAPQGAAVVQPKVDAEELKTFLEHIAWGRQDQAEAMLKINKDLALVSGDVTDHAKRTLKNITGFQYAVWALNWKMCTMIVGYLNPEAAKEQTKVFQASSIKEHTEQANWEEENEMPDISDLISQNGDLHQQRSELVTDILRRVVIFSTLGLIRGSVLDVPCIPHPVMSIVVEYDKIWHEFQMFLNHIAWGRQDEAEAMLKISKDLALVRGDVTDHANRTFTNITGFQYAVWALDWKMWTMILPYLPPEVAREQAQGFTEASWVKEHAEHANWKNLIDALQVYIDNYSHWTWEQCQKHWVEQVGGAQFKLPIHVLQEYCNPNRPFEPCPKFDAQYPLERSLPDWLIKALNKAEFHFGLLRYDFRLAAGQGRPWMAAPVPTVTAVDRLALISLYDNRIQQRAKLLAQLLGNDASQAQKPGR